MMNAARLGVGLQGLAIAEVAYQNAVQYAGDRRQGRALTGPKEPNEKADTLFVHPDVRRMLMEAKAWTEGLRALCLWGALQVDLEHNAGTEEEREMAGDLIGLLTPVIKGVGTDKGYEIATNAQQVYGGHGYIQEWGMEQYVRDARIAMIYEGTNGIVTEETAAAEGVEATAGIAAALKKALGELQAATMWFMANGMKNPENVGAGAVPYMHLMGIVATGLMWLRMAKAAAEQKAAGEGDAAFLDAKLVTARFFAERICPDAGALRRKIEGGAESVMALPPEMFRAARCRAPARPAPSAPDWSPPPIPIRRGRHWPAPRSSASRCRSCEIVLADHHQRLIGIARQRIGGQRLDPRAVALEQRHRVECRIAGQGFQHIIAQREGIALAARLAGKFDLAVGGVVEHARRVDRNAVFGHHSFLASGVLVCRTAGCSPDRTRPVSVEANRLAGAGCDLAGSTKLFAAIGARRSNRRGKCAANSACARPAPPTVMSRLAWVAQNRIVRATTSGA
ncbi:hypothetical protein WR25_10699 [Diploscapter pachys]|uniref:Acetyl-CoA dehydrogenase-like C-terminal domain-containing protein n=1 Tax=Diploscapter pachys TaxID=2018661 RepID=A0A2A2K5X1_9BILA|nr:hypothetical protein WR25_10699 [Diploscapter pachys]